MYDALDLRDFFASVTAGRVFGIFRTLGYNRSVAHVLTGLSTNTISQAVWAAVPRAPRPALVQPRFWLGRALATPHLPQGAPTSPALPNLAAFSLDRRLTGLANSAGLRYSRYADDLTFSGSVALRRRRRHLEALIGESAHDQGFAINERKNRAALGRRTPVGVRHRRQRPPQRAPLRVRRAQGDPAQRGSPGAGQPEPRRIADFAAHLRGRIAWVASLNPARGEKLCRRFAEIRWEDR